MAEVFEPELRRIRRASDRADKSFLAFVLAAQALATSGSLEPERVELFAPLVRVQSVAQSVARPVAGGGGYVLGLSCCKSNDD